MGKKLFSHVSFLFGYLKKLNLRLYLIVMDAHTCTQELSERSVGSILSFLSLNKPSVQQHHITKVD